MSRKNRKRSDPLVSVQWDGPRRRPIPSSRLRRRFVLTTSSEEPSRFVSVDRVLDGGGLLDPIRIPPSAAPGG